MFFLGFAFGSVSTLSFHLLANSFAYVSYICEISHILRELIVQLRQAFLLDGLNLNSVGKSLSCKPFIGVVIGKINFERAFDSCRYTTRCSSTIHLASYC